MQVAMSAEKPTAKTMLRMISPVFMSLPPNMIYPVRDYPLGTLPLPLDPPDLDRRERGGPWPFLVSSRGSARHSPLDRRSSVGSLVIVNEPAVRADDDGHEPERPARAARCRARKSRAVRSSRWAAALNRSWVPWDRKQGTATGRPGWPPRRRRR